MAKRGNAVFGMMVVLLLAFSAAGCDKIGKKEKDGEKFERGSSGLEMEFVQNYPQQKFLISNEDENILVAINVRNFGTYPTKTSKLERSGEEVIFGAGKIYLSGFDDRIIDIGKKSIGLSDLFLQPASEINPKGGLDTAEFEGEIIADKIIVDKYEPTILATACYPYFTKASPTVCIDPFPFEQREEKVCQIGSTTLTSQGAPIAVTKVEQEAATRKIQFKIHIKNVGTGDVIWDKDALTGGEKAIGGKEGLLNRCSPLGGGILDRKDFDRVQVESIMIGEDDMLKNGECSPFADGTNNVVRLFNGEGFIICTYNVPQDTQTTYTTPLNIELRYAYRSTISKPITISKLATIETREDTTKPMGEDDFGVVQENV